MPIACNASLGADPVEAASASGCSPQSCGSAGRRGNPSSPCPCYFVELHYPWLEGFGNGVVRTADPRPLQIGNNHYERLAPPSSRACSFCIIPWWVWQLTRPPHRDRGPLASPQLMRGDRGALELSPKVFATAFAALSTSSPGEFKLDFHCEASGNITTTMKRFFSCVRPALTLLLLVSAF